MSRFVILLAILGIAGGMIAGRKGRNPIMWFILCALFPLLIIVIALFPARASKGYTKKCLYCAEIIKKDAEFCKHCGKEQPIEMVKVSSDR